MEESNEPIANEQFQKDSERFTRLVTFSPDPLVLILKGHLLIEEQLNKFLVTGTSKPETLIDARLSFHQTLRIAQAIGGALFSDELVLLIEKLNALRNRLAHMAEPQGIDDKLHEFELSGLTLFPGLAKIPEGPVRLYGVLQDIFAFLAGLHQGFQIMRQYNVSLPPVKR